ELYDAAPRGALLHVPGWVLRPDRREDSALAVPGAGETGVPDARLSTAAGGDRQRRPGVRTARRVGRPGVVARTGNVAARFDGALWVRAARRPRRGRVVRARPVLEALRHARRHGDARSAA